MYRIAFACLLAVYSLSFSFHVHAQSLPGDEINPASFDIDVSRDLEDPAVLRTRYASIESFTPGSDLSLHLFPDADFTAIHVRTEHHSTADSWVGQIGGNPHAYVIVSYSGNTLFAKVVDEQMRQFLIVRRAEGIYAIQEIESSMLAEDLDDVEITEDEGEGGAQKQAGICDASYSCSAKTVDLMVVYTTDAKNQLGGTNASAEAAITTAVAEMNTANTNSGVTHTFNLAHTQEVIYSETNNSSTDLTNLRTYGDGQLDIVHPLRYTHQADLVALITGTTNYCGRGNLQTSPTNFYYQWGFCVANYSCMTGNFTLAHEFGHNMGLRHDNYVDGSTTPCAHNKGYVNDAADPASADYTGKSAQRWRTIMAYTDKCTDLWGFYCSRIGYWSNPSVDYNTGAGAGPGSGIDPMGIITTGTDPADNAYSLNRAICLVADMSLQLTPLPVDFAFIRAEADGKKALIEWGTSFELNNAGFEVEMKSETETEYRNLDFVKGQGDSEKQNNYQFATHSLLPGTYQFRLKQVDMDGTFAYSQVVETVIASTGGPEVVVAPNPFSDAVRFEVSLSTPMQVNISLFDAMGQEIRQIHAGKLTRGLHAFQVPAADLSSGVYFYRVSGTGFLQSGKIIRQ